MTSSLLHKLSTFLVSFLSELFFPCRFPLQLGVVLVFLEEEEEVADEEDVVKMEKEDRLRRQKRMMRRRHSWKRRWKSRWRRRWRRSTQIHSHRPQIGFPSGAKRPCTTPTGLGAKCPYTCPAAASRVQHPPTVQLGAKRPWTTPTIFFSGRKAGCRPYTTLISRRAAGVDVKWLVEYND